MKVQKRPFYTRVLDIFRHPRADGGADVATLKPAPTAEEALRALVPSVEAFTAKLEHEFGCALSQVVRECGENLREGKRTATVVIDNIVVVSLPNFAERLEASVRVILESQGYKTGAIIVTFINKYGPCRYGHRHMVMCDQGCVEGIIGKSAEVSILLEVPLLLKSS